MSRNKFGPQRGPWTDHDWLGWWGQEPPFHTPVFVMTHHERPSFILPDDLPLLLRPPRHGAAASARGCRGQGCTTGRWRQHHPAVPRRRPRRYPARRRRPSDARRRVPAVTIRSRIFTAVKESRRRAVALGAMWFDHRYRLRNQVRGGQAGGIDASWGRRLRLVTVSWSPGPVATNKCKQAKGTAELKELLLIARGASGLSASQRCAAMGCLSGKASGYG